MILQCDGCVVWRLRGPGLTRPCRLRATIHAPDNGRRNGDQRLKGWAPSLARDDGSGTASPVSECRLSSSGMWEKQSPDFQELLFSVNGTASSALAILACAVIDLSMKALDWHSLGSGRCCCRLKAFAARHMSMKWTRRRPPIEHGRIKEATVASQHILPPECLV